jgi:ParB-like chromosome segregation protein Spo0J
MREAKIENRVTSIPIDKLVPHPGSPNRMSRRNFARLIRNIERTGCYEPLVVRPCPARGCHSCETRNPEALGQAKHGCFEIINGHHRLRALKQLGFEAVDAVIWDVDDAETDILLSTLNRLGGSDVLEKKLVLLDRINHNMEAREMTKLLPFTRSQIEKLKNIKVPSALTNIKVENFAVPMVFFLNADQQRVVAQALASVRDSQKEITKAAWNAWALTEIAKCFIRDRNRWG